MSINQPHPHTRSPSTPRRRQRRPAPRIIITGLGRARGAGARGAWLAALWLAPLAALAIAACGSAGHAASGPKPARSSTAKGSTPTTSTRSDTSATTSTTRSTTTPTGTAASTSTTASTSAGSGCRSDQLQIVERSFGAGHYGQAALGHSSVVLVFTNTGRTPCTLAGYPGVAGLNAAGAQVTQARRTPSGYMGGLSSGATTPPVVTLDPNQSASAIVEGTDVPSGNESSCPTLSGLLVTAPNTTRSVKLPAAPGDCSGLQVHPVVPGDSGSQSG